MTPTWDDLAASTSATQADRNLLIAIIAADIDTLEQINLGNAFTYEIMLIAAHRQSAADYWYRQGKDDAWEAAAAEERAKIVGYARGHGGNAWSRDVLYFAEKIEAGEHLK